VSVALARREATIVLVAHGERAMLGERVHW
jgi:hypothetical protein